MGPKWESDSSSSHQQDRHVDFSSPSPSESHSPLSLSDNDDSVLNEAKSSRKALTEDDVIAIFSAGNFRPGSSTVKLWARGQILALSRIFKVTPKTIRDIWNRRTWRGVTSRLILKSQQAVMEHGFRIEACHSRCTSEARAAQTSSHANQTRCFMSGNSNFAMWQVDVETRFLPCNINLHDKPLYPPHNTSAFGYDHACAATSIQHQQPRWPVDSPPPSSVSSQHSGLLNMPAPPCTSQWPGDALLLAAATSLADPSVWEGQPIAGSSGCGGELSASRTTSAAGAGEEEDPFARDWAFW
jgi:hypothetical protein